MDVFLKYVLPIIGGLAAIVTIVGFFVKKKKNSEQKLFIQKNGKQSKNYQGETIIIKEKSNYDEKNDSK